MRKYYIGSKAMSEMLGAGKDPNGAYETFEEALAEATRLLTSHDRTTAMIVQITHIVKLTPPPVTIQEV